MSLLKRRWFKILLGVVIVLVLLWVFVVPIVITMVAEGALEDRWGGKASIDGIDFDLGNRLIDVSGVRCFGPDEEIPMLEIGDIAVRLEDEETNLKSAEVQSIVVRSEGRKLVEVPKLLYDTQDRSITVDGAHVVYMPNAPSPWQTLIDRVMSAPVLNQEPSGEPSEPMGPVRVRNARVSFEITEGENPATIAIEGLNFDLKTAADGKMSLEDLRGNVLGGEIAGFGSLVTGDTLNWSVQANLVTMDMGVAGDAIHQKASGYNGKLSAFVDLKTLPDQGGAVVGAGWIKGKDLRMWNQPVMAAILTVLGLSASESDALGEVKGSFRADHGRFFFKDIMAVGTPVSFYGNGSVKLDGSELDIGIVPRFLGEKEVGSLPLLGAPTQTLLDVVKGSALELRASGSISNVEVAVKPLAAVTDPINSFFGILGGGGDKKK